MQINKGHKIGPIFLLFLFLFESIFLFLSFPVHADQSTSVAVPPRQSDYQFNFSSVDGYNYVTPGTTLSYQIEYGTYASAVDDSPITLTVNYSSDIAPTGANILDYVSGSATNAYNNAQPIINPINHTITWSLPSLPAGTTNQVVDFQLETNANYTGYDNVNFTIQANMSTQYQTLPTQSVNQIYQIIPPATPTPSPAPPKVPQPLPTPTITVNPLTFTAVTITGITQSRASVQVATSNTATTTVLYGLSPTDLTDSTQSSLYETTSNFSLNALSPNTTYYIEATAFDLNGQRSISEIYQIHTATPSVPQTLQNSIVVVTSGNITLSSNILQTNNSIIPVIVVPVNTDFTLSITPQVLVMLNAVNAIVLNASNQEIMTVPLIKLEQGTLFSNLQAPNIPEVYTVIVQTLDGQGNLIQNPLFHLQVAPPLTIVDQQSGQTLPHARIFLYILNPLTNKYVPLNEVFENLKNPLYTNASGEINIALPKGSYKAIVEDLSYSEQTIKFTVGYKNGAGFPLITLQNNPLDFVSYLKYFKDSLLDEFSTIVQALQALAGTAPFLNLSALSILAWAGPVNFTLFSLRTHIKFRQLPPFLYFHIFRNKEQNKKTIIQGTIIDEQGLPLSKVQIEFIDSQKNIIVKQVSTNKNGHFYVKNSFDANTAQLICTKEGYAPTVLAFGPFIQSTSSDPIITLRHGFKKQPQVFPLLLTSIAHFAGSLYEVSLVMSFLIELFSIPIFGFSKTAPFILLSLFNWLLWMFYMRERFEWKWQKKSNINY